ncbi:hypothetical protein BDZ89DRAFT_1168053 [Hymenopellis radicata]|nr:hypothetical protein BDZ89DRAFT_1168053 [Hymenopellis radicata]
MSSNTVAPPSDETRPPDPQQPLNPSAEFHRDGSNGSSSGSTLQNSVVPDDGGAHQDSCRSPDDSDVMQKGSPFFGVRHSSQWTPGVVDPFDYEQKYGEDKPYEEMGESGRMWKTYLSESAKVDADKVMSWTDALDVLLVFAGLFSAVVSTFVAQTFQTLQIDNGEVTAYLVFELVHLQRAVMDGLTPMPSLIPISLQI